MDALDNECLLKRIAFIKFHDDSEEDLAKARKIFANIKKTIIRLQADKCIYQRRYAARTWLDYRLTERFCAEIDAILEDAALTARDQRLRLEAKAEELNLSVQRKKEFRRAMSEPTFDTAADFLKSMYLVRARAELTKKAKLSGATWSRFIHVTTCPSEETVNRIIEGLKLIHGLELNEEDERKFRALVIRDHFKVTDSLREEVRIRKGAESAESFCKRNFISSKAWTPFRPNQIDALTTQSTLLKLVIGFGLSPHEGKAFLALVDSAFLTRRDHVVLACITEALYDVYVVHVILELSQSDSPYEKPYINIYLNIS